MAHAEKTVLIHRPVESVFDFMLNGANNRLWRSSVLDVKPLSQPPYGVGSRFALGLKGPTGRIPTDYEITEAKPFEMIRFRVTAGPAQPTVTYLFQRQGHATELSSVLDYQPDDLSKSMDRRVAQEIFQELLKSSNGQAAAMLERLSQPERQVLRLVAEGKSEREVGQSLSIGEGTSRNYVFSALSKIMEPIVQRSMNEEVEMLNDLKLFLEKHV